MHTHTHTQPRSEMKLNQTLIEYLLGKTMFCPHLSTVRPLHSVSTHINYWLLLVFKWHEDKFFFPPSDCWQETAGERATSWKKWPAINLAISIMKMGPRKTYKSVWYMNIESCQTIKCLCNRQSNGQGEIYLFGLYCATTFSIVIAAGIKNFCSKLTLKKTS